MKTTKILLFSILLTIVLLPNAYSQNSEFYYENDINNQYEWCYEEWHRRIMRNEDFSDLKKVISDRWFESTMLEFAKSAIYDNYFTIEQVRELLGLFSFESSKIELAKLAYSKTVNNRKYYKLFDLFWFESSVTELNDFIRKFCN